MKNKLFVLLTLLFLLTGCNQSKISNNPVEEFMEPDPGLYVELMPAIREYFYLRKQAMLLNDSTDFYENYPDLLKDVDLAKGINAETKFFEYTHSQKPFDGNILPDFYERMAVKQTETETQVLLHGIELYLWKNIHSEYDEFGGEFKIVLFMRQQESGWQIFKTDEVTLDEWKSFQP